jgi:hypothetical protein
VAGESRTSDADDAACLAFSFERKIQSTGGRFDIDCQDLALCASVIAS